MIEFITLPSMHHDPVVRSSIPRYINNFDVATVVYNREKPIHPRIFHFNTFVSSLDVDRFLRDNTILSCNSGGSEFIDQRHKHILTGILKNIRDKLRKLFTKGPKHRDNKTISSGKIPN